MTSPSVSLDLNGPYSIVNIRSNEDKTICIQLTMHQFSSLMLQLNALEQMFVQQSLAQPAVQQSLAQPTLSGHEQWLNQVLLGNEDKITQVSDDMETINIPLEPNEPAPPKSNVRGELAKLYAEVIMTRLPDVVKLHCYGCKNQINAKKNLIAHDVCRTKTRCERIDCFFDEIIEDVDEELIKERLEQHMRDRALPFNLEKMYVKKETLLSNLKWKNTVKRHAENL